MLNLVPESSEVIRRVSRNDLLGLQKQFDNREASPLDVDPRGYSSLSVSLTGGGFVRNIDSNVLLSNQYAMYTGCSETLLPLQVGAGTQNCKWSVRSALGQCI